MLAIGRSTFMFITGHLAVGTLIVTVPALINKKQLQIKNALLPAILGALTPDIIDKSFQLIGVTPFGRSLGHSVFFWAPLLLLLMLQDRKKGKSFYAWWVYGGLSHLLIDLINDFVRGLEFTGYLFSAWMAWPFTNADMAQVKIPFEDVSFDRVSSLEVVAIVAALFSFVVLIHRQRKSPDALVPPAEPFDD